MNLIGSRPDGWWRDRPAAQRRLGRQLHRYARESGEEVVLVLDGRRPADWEEPLETVFAGGARDAADDAIVARLEADPAPEALSVVTSDRGLEERVRELGAAVISVSAFRRRLEELVDE
jgi:uncharacterized protein YaiI (UPF0178 family)